jgi:signal peptidase I
MKFFENRIVIRILIILWVACVREEARSAGFVPQDAPPIPAKAEIVVRAQEIAHSVRGHAAAVAATGSMLPTLTPADIIVYHGVPFSDIKVGDIVLFKAVLPGCARCAPSIYAHRVVTRVTDTRTVLGALQVNAQHQWVRSSHEEVSTYLVTKGDHNEAPDDFKIYEVIGVVSYIINGQTGDTRKL